MSPAVPIVMLHGAFCGGWAFETFREPFLRAGFEVHTPTLRHHGGKDSGSPGRLSLRDYLLDLDALLDRLDGVPVILGHSLGGLLAQMLAARRKLRAAVLIAPSAPWGIMPTTFFEVASAQALWMRGDYWNEVLKPSYRIAASYSLDRMPRAERDAIFARFVPESGLATFEIVHWTLDSRRSSEVLAQAVTCPILCIAGSDDRINPPSTVREIAARYGQKARLEVLQGRSHWAIGEPGWEELAARIIAWLQEILSAAPISPATQSSR
ncbi:MAG: alpha/beta hydrolase [Alphaproteobacteria bacterium]|nr:alpha/beta hydrolase [Alphaproteobacteria bacterium]